MENMASVTAEDIAIKAGLLYTIYPKNASALELAKERLNDLRCDTEFMERYPTDWEQAIAEEEREQRAATEMCRKCADELGKLAVMCATHLPEIWPEMRLVSLRARWHETPGFDWDTGIAELRKIEATALSTQQAGHTDSRDDKTSSTTPKTKKPTVNARMIDLISKKPESHTWSARMFADALGCAKSTAGDSPAFKNLGVYRTAAKLERAKKKQEQWQGKGADEPDDFE